jgi:hypothetical protein
MESPFGRIALRSVSLGLLGILATVIPAQAATSSVNTSRCTSAEYFQPFLYAGDSNWYVALPGDTYDSFSGAGWQLSGGAKVLSTTLSDGEVGSVLDLPSGSKAVSPVICVTSEFPTARGIVRNVKGAEGVSFNVEYEGTATWGKPKNTGQIHGNGTAWTLVTPVNLQPEKTTGLQPMRITLVPGGSTSEFQVYNLFADPRMR